MNPEYITLNDVHLLHLVFRAYRSHDGLGVLFRGQADSSWELLPKAGRKEFYLPENRDLGRFWLWRRQAVAYSPLPSSDLEGLALAQHHGLATRLLDWSMNPLVACFFACTEQPNKDGAVYMYETPALVLNEEKQDIENLKKLKGVFGFLPRAISPRVLNQKGVFTVHCDASQTIQIENSNLDNAKPNLTILIIPSKFKTDVLKHLEDYGIDRSFLFSDLDGLSTYINGKTLRMERKDND